MSISKDDILNAVAEMSVMDVVALIEAMEEKFGVSAATAVAAAGPAEAAEEKTEFDVVMTSFGEKKVAVIKAVRGATGLGLKEAKDLLNQLRKRLKKALTKLKLKSLRKLLKKQVLLLRSNSLFLNRLFA